MSLILPVFKLPSAGESNPLTSVIYGIADFERLAGFEPQASQTYNVGYIGTVNFSKMYHRYVPMSANIDLPNLRFVVCGGGIENQLRIQAQELHAEAKFDFRGYVENIKPVLETLHVFGYPLCQDTYATSEKSLQEAMYAGVPPVVFPYGGVKCLVEHSQTGLVVHSEREYQQAIEYLYHHPQERSRLGQNAQAYAQKHFASAGAAEQFETIYQQLMTRPKRHRVWSDSNAQSATPSAARWFIESLGHTATHLSESLQAQTRADWVAADQKIAESSPLMATGEGGIIHYRNYYPADPYLHLWAGLVLLQTGQYDKAMREFQSAMERGLSRDRVSDYLGQAAEKRVS
jgi:tetratricopeptide (TPR) repeat protein